MEKFLFPKDFLWGAATSAHQVEGGMMNDWTRWEHANAVRLAHDAKLKSYLDFILQNYPNPLIEENYISGRGANHYDRFREDFDIARELGHNAHRFSIEWSRIEPEKGKFDEREIEHYLEVIRALRERGMEPFVTLWHWTIPLWLRDKGGVESENFPQYFLNYVEKIHSALKNEVKFWITLNEPNVYTSHSYLKGHWPPQRKSPWAARRVLLNLAEAHRRAYAAIKEKNQNAQIGIAQNTIYFSKFGASLKRFLWNNWFIIRISSHQDFIGVNYYFSDRETKDRSEFSNWPIDPEGIYFVLQDIKKYGKPIYITENGIADARDEKRAQFIRDHLRSIAKAMQDGADIRGYLYWSLLDNFEWDSGFWPRFGLVEMDYRTQERKIRPSAWAYKKIIFSRNA